MRRLAATILFAIVALSGAALRAEDRKPFAIGYLEITDDPRYAERRGYTGVQLWTRYRPVDGAETAIRDSKVLGRALGLNLSLTRAEAPDAEGLATQARQMLAKDGVRFFLVDAASDVLLTLADALAGEDALLFNIAEPDDALRRKNCRRNLMHVLPDRSMLADALVQYLVAKSWRNVLVLRGPLPEDTVLARAFAASAHKFGAKIVATRDFVLSNDPRERDQNNIVLLTGAPDYDVVFLADSDGEFGRYVPYQTGRPRPIVGSEGLIASAWDWSWERHGAPQLNQRFDRTAARRMQDMDWAAWAAVKAVLEAASRTGGADFAAIDAYLRGPELTLDAYKGTPSSFRPWNNQLRQPILLHTHDATIARAPLPEFLHQRDTLDTLGIDEPESTCRF